MEDCNIPGHDASGKDVGGGDGEEKKAGHGDKLVVLEGPVRDEDPAGVHDVVQGGDGQEGVGCHIMGMNCPVQHDDDKKLEYGLEVKNEIITCLRFCEERK